MTHWWRRIFRLTPAKVLAVNILMWMSVAVMWAVLDMSRPWLLGYCILTMVYAFFVAGWAMLRTLARLRGVMDEGEAPDGGLLLEALPEAALVLTRRGKVKAMNNAWLDLFGMPRNQVWRKTYDRFVDPVLRRHIDQAAQSRQPARSLQLSARRPDGKNIFFITDIIPLGSGLLVAARPWPRRGLKNNEAESDRSDRSDEMTPKEN